MNFDLDAAGVNMALLTLVKVILIVGGALYFVFAFIVIRQISVMRKTLITPLEPEIAFLGWLHLGMTTGLFLYFLFAL